ncbi:hypothetical protein ABQD64_05410 [Vagococcus fluvialis]|uniref:hypothetical protein n=1 Tax=Vagococcus fluvialis TaxID=2738 RepID=UPI0032E46FC2
MSNLRTINIDNVAERFIEFMEKQMKENKIDIILPEQNKENMKSVVRESSQETLEGAIAESMGVEVLEAVFMVEAHRKDLNK